MKLYQLIAELENRNISLTLCEDGRLKVEPVGKVKDLIEWIKEHREGVMAYVKGEYCPTAEHMASYLKIGERYWVQIVERYPKSEIVRAKKKRMVVEQVNGWFRLPSESEKNVEPYQRRRKAA